MNEHVKRGIKMKNEKLYETCVVCKRLTDVKKDKDVNDRLFYVKGVGQLCETCFHEVFYMKQNKDN